MVGRVKNPCKVCNETVTKKSGLQCQGVCKKWAHFACLNYSPQQINAVLSGVTKIICPCAECTKKKDIQTQDKELQEVPKIHTKTDKPITRASISTTTHSPVPLLDTKAPAPKAAPSSDPNSPVTRTTVNSAAKQTIITSIPKTTAKGPLPTVAIPATTPNRTVDTPTSTTPELWLTPKSTECSPTKSIAPSPTPKSVLHSPKALSPTPIEPSLTTKTIISTPPPKSTINSPVPRTRPIHNYTTEYDSTEKDMNIIKCSCDPGPKVLYNKHGRNEILITVEGGKKEKKQNTRLDTIKCGAKLCIKPTPFKISKACSCSLFANDCVGSRPFITRNTNSDSEGSIPKRVQNQSMINALHNVCETIGVLTHQMKYLMTKMVTKSVLKEV